MADHWGFSVAAIGVCESDFGARFSLCHGAMVDIPSLVAEGALVAFGCRDVAQHRRFGVTPTAFEWRHHLGGHRGGDPFVCPNTFASLAGYTDRCRGDRLWHALRHPASLSAKTMANCPRLLLGGRTTMALSISPSHLGIGGGRLVWAGAFSGSAKVFVFALCPQRFCLRCHRRRVGLFGERRSPRLFHPADLLGVAGGCQLPRPVPFGHRWRIGLLSLVSSDVAHCRQCRFASADGHPVALCQCGRFIALEHPFGDGVVGQCRPTIGARRAGEGDGRCCG
ncbi:MAG: hypothetical protein PVTTEEND_000685 [Candidatus Fervidibacter sp.]